MVICNRISSATMSITSIKSSSVPSQMSNQAIMTGSWRCLNFPIGGACCVVKMQNMRFLPLQFPCGLVTQSFCMKKGHQSGKQHKLQRNWDQHLYKRTAMSGSGTKAKSLVDIVIPLSNVKEEIYGALDEWVAFELEFPVVAVRKALERLKQQKEWQRIIQVSKWMLSKGHGQTFGTYDLMLKAYDMDARLEDAEALWENLLAKHASSLPKSMFARMMSTYKWNKMPFKILEVFEQMEKLDMKPDMDMVHLAGKAYESMGMVEKQKELLEKYPPKWEYHTFKGKTIRVPPRQAFEVDPTADLSPVLDDGPGSVDDAADNIGQLV